MPAVSLRSRSRNLRGRRCWIGPHWPGLNGTGSCRRLTAVICSWWRFITRSKIYDGKHCSAVRAQRRPGDVADHAVRGGGGGGGWGTLFLVAARKPPPRSPAPGASAGRGREWRYCGGDQSGRGIRGPDYSDDLSWIKPLPRLDAGSAATGGGDRIGAGGAFPHRDGHAGNARAALGIAGDGDWTDARVPERGERRTFRGGSDGRHRRGVDRDGLRPWHRDSFPRAVQLLQRARGAVAVRVGGGGHQRRDDGPSSPAGGPRDETGGAARRRFARRIGIELMKLSSPVQRRH